MSSLKKITDHITIGNIVACAIFALLQHIFGFINMLSGWSLFSKYVALQFRDYIIFPQGYQNAQRVSYQSAGSK